MASHGAPARVVAPTQAGTTPWSSETEARSSGRVILGPWPGESDILLTTMARRGLAGATFVLLLVAALSPWGAPVAAARDDEPSHKSEDARVPRKAWYQSAPPCAALDCSAIPPINPYPEGTLHVAVSAGQETARTYLALVFELPEETEPIGGTLELPVDADATHGSLSPEAARIVACSSTDEFKDERGAVATPPKIDCDVRRSAVYEEKKARFTIDLGRFAENWVAEPSGEWNAALALVPSPSAQADGETWRAVFPAADPPRKKSERKEDPVITATIEYGPAEDEGLLGPNLFGPGSDTTGGTGNDFSSGSGADFDTGSTGSDVGSGSSDVSAETGNESGVGSFGSAAGATDAVGGDSATTPAEIAAPPGSLVGFAGPGFAYPIMWALPLTILVAVAAAGRALTKDLYRRGL